MKIPGVVTTAEVHLDAVRVALSSGTRQTHRRLFLTTPLSSSLLALHLKSTKPICLPTWVVFDGEIWVVEHLWDEAVVEEVALDGVVSIHRADNLDHLR